MGKEKQQANNSGRTIFKYHCDKCKNTDFMEIHMHLAHCKHCDRSYPLSAMDVILFDQDKSEQKKYFNKLYRKGYSPLKDALIKDSEKEYQASVEKAAELLKLWGLGDKLPIEGKTFLDAACGPGWLTAGLMQNQQIINSRFHAFDISVTGLDLLAKLSKDNENSNQLELSVQNAENLRFDSNTFDFIIGHSMLHHLTHYETFLETCYEILKPEGVAFFGEPFAIGYGLLAASLKLAQDDLGTHYEAIDELYENIAFRANSPRKLLKKFLDKHLFFQSEILQTAQEIGFSSVDFVSLMDRDYYRNSFITDELRIAREIKDEQLIARAKTIYKTFFDIFDSDRFVHSASAFIYIILRH